MKLAEEIYRIKKVQSRLQKISVIAIEFKTRTREITEAIQGQLTWLETNKEISENAPMKNPKKLQIEYDIINFSSKAAERLIVAVEKSMQKCTELYKKVLTTHNICHTSSIKRL